MKNDIAWVWCCSCADVVSQSVAGGDSESTHQKYDRSSDQRRAAGHSHPRSGKIPVAVREGRRRRTTPRTGGSSHPPHCRKAWHLRCVLGSATGMSPLPVRAPACQQAQDEACEWERARFRSTLTAMGTARALLSALIFGCKPTRFHLAVLAVPLDFYLRLTGAGGKLLRGEIPLTDKVPSLTK